MISEWISVDDRLPKDAGKVIVAVVYTNDNYKMIDTGCYQINHGTTYINGDRETKPWQVNGHCQSHLVSDEEDYFIVTHWMPLPDQPAVSHLDV